MKTLWPDSWPVLQLPALAMVSGQQLGLSAAHPAHAILS